MSDKLLSQTEIEALMSGLALDTDESPAATAVAEPVQSQKSVKVYDFRRPDKFSKGHLRALRILHGTFARVLSSSLTSYLRTNIQLRLTMVEQVTYEEYIRSLPSPTVLYVVTPTPLPGQLVIEMNLPLVRGVLDRLLGGSGIVDGKQRDMTDIERALLKTVGGFLLGSLREVWTEVVNLQPSAQEPALMPELVQVTLPTETTVMLLFEMTLAHTTGTLSVCIPHPVLQPVMNLLTTSMWSGGHSRSGEPDEAPLPQLDQLRPVSLPLVVELGSASLTVRELLNLPVGQVIKLDTSAQGSLAVRVGEHTKFTARPGLVGRNMAVEITGALN